MTTLLGSHPELTQSEPSLTLPTPCLISPPPRPHPPSPVKERRDHYTHEEPLPAQSTTGREMTQWVKGLATKPQELSSIPWHPSLPQTLIPLLPQAIGPSSTIPQLCLPRQTKDSPLQDETSSPVLVTRSLEPFVQ